MRSSLVLFFALVIQVLTSVATNPTPTTSISRRARGPKRYHPGDMIRVKPSAWEKAEGKTLNHGSQTEHFGVVLGKNQGKYKIAHISHNLPADYTHRDDASKYHKKADPGSMINTGTPKEVAAGDLRLAKKPFGWNKMTGGKLRNLKAEINKNCGTNLRRRGLGCPLHKPNQHTPKGQSHQLQGKKAGPKNAPKGRSRQLQGKKAGPKPNRNAPQGKSRPLRGKKA